MHHDSRCARLFAAVLATAALASCGGGGGSSTDNNPPPAPAPAPSPGVAAQSCSANNPYIGDASAPTTIGSLASEKAWLRDYMDRKYLWYAEVPNVDASDAAYSDESAVFLSLYNYFGALRTPAITASGKAKDQFSFTYSTAQWDALINSGSTVGYGIEWRFGSPNPNPSRNIRVEYVHAGSPAEANGILRGDTLVLADNISADDPTKAGIDAINSALFPAAAGTHTFQFSRAGGAVLDITLTAGNVSLAEVERRVLNVSGQNVGYILFNDHGLTAEQKLISAFQALKNANVSDLVLDLRYNGGGPLFIASEVAYMIAGDKLPTANEVFVSTVFNNKRSSENTSTGFQTQACVPDPTTSQCRSSDPLPTLNLSRVYVLVSDRTCSTSEAIINGLRGVDIDVRLIGSTTCGVPYGVGDGQDNCGITYFPIESQAVNAKGFGDYSDGFNPGGAWVDPGAAGPTGFAVSGCAANDDLNHQLGDPAEGQLAAALSYRASGNTACLPLAVANRQTPLAAARGAAAGRVVKPVALTSRNGRMPAR